MNTAIATQHKNQMYRLIESAGTTITVTPPAARAASSNDTEKIWGTSGSTETDSGTPVSITAHIHNARVPSDFRSRPTDPGAIPVGLLTESDIILSVKLEDALNDVTKPFGRTIFDDAKSIQVVGSEFTVTGTFRSGLAPLGPYILWVGLENVGE